MRYIEALFFSLFCMFSSPSFFTWDFEECFAVHSFLSSDLIELIISGWNIIFSMSAGYCCWTVFTCSIKFFERTMIVWNSGDFASEGDSRAKAIRKKIFLKIVRYFFILIFVKSPFLQNLVFRYKTPVYYSQARSALVVVVVVVAWKCLWDDLAGWRLMVGDWSQAEVEDIHSLAARTCVQERKTMHILDKGGLGNKGSMY